MRRNKKHRCLSVWVTVVLLLTCLGFGYSASAEGSLELTFQDDGKFVLTDKATGQAWYSSPPGVQENPSISGAPKTDLQSMLIVEYRGDNNQTAKVNSFVGSVRKEGLTLEKIPDGMKYIYRFPMKTGELCVPVCVTLKDGYVRAEIVASEIQDFEGARILKITLLPYFCAGSREQSGYLFVPDGCGALINCNNGKGNYEQYEEQVYGRDPLQTVTYDRPVKQTIHLPVFGIHTGETGLFGIIEQGDFSASIIANVTGSVSSPYYNQVAGKFTYRSNDTIIMAEATFSPREVSIVAKSANTANNFAIRYYPLKGQDATYAGMAKTYRQYLQTEKGLTKKSDAGKPSFLVELIGGIKKKSSFLGFPIQQFVPLTTYDEAQKIVEELQDGGIDRLGLKYTGWTKNGAKTTIDAKIQYDNRLGGKSDFNTLQNYMVENGFGYYPDIELQKVYQNGNGYKGRADSSRTLANLPAMGYLTRPDTYRKNMDRLSWFLLSPTLYPKVMGSLLKDSNLPVGMSIGSFGSLVYGDYANDGALYRDDAAVLLTEQLAQLSEKRPQLLANDCNAYALPYIQTVSCAPLYSSRFDVADAEVPFYQMVISGLIDYTSSPLNNYGDTTQAFLKTVQTGASPMYQWIARDPSLLKKSELQEVYAAGYRQWLDEACGQYRRLKDSLGAVTDFAITGFETVSEELTITKLADGTSIYVNFGEQPAQVGGVTVAARDFTVVKGG